MSTEPDLALVRAPSEILFASGAVRALPRVLARHGRRILACVDPVMAGSPSFRAFGSAAAAAGLQVEVHTEFAAELPLADVEAAVHRGRACDPQVVLGFGGGSALDLAKLVAVGIEASSPLEHFYGENKVDGVVRPVVAVPTTAGTGSEVTPVAVLADPKRELKVGVSSPRLVPVAAVVDPDLTVTCPSHVTAHSGIDALCHAVEALTAAPRSPDLAEVLPVFVGSNPFSSHLSIDAATKIVRALPRAVAQGDDVGARRTMSYASLVAGISFSTAGTHLAHAIQYPVGSLTRTPHGLGVGLLLPYVLEACLPFAATPLARVGRALGSDADSDEEAATSAIRAIVELRRAIGSPHTLAEIGVERADLPRVVRLAGTVERLVANSPLPDPHSQLDSIVERAWSGTSDLFPSP